MKLGGIIFDMDGTLIDSGYDFDVIRNEMGLKSEQPILESIETMPAGKQKDHCQTVLRKHELAGANRATLMPGVDEFLEQLTQDGFRQGILTRNSREATDLVLSRLNLSFATVLTRGEAPPKPNPAGLLQICEEWELSVDSVLMFGDFHFDLQVGKNAGVRTVLYAPGELPSYADEADFVIRHFSEATEIIAQLNQ